MSSRKKARDHLERAINNLEWTLYHLKSVYDMCDPNHHKKLREYIEVLASGVVVLQAKIKELRDNI